MTFGVRLKMSPLPALEGAGRVARVRGLDLRMLRLGKVGSQLSLEGKKPGEIVFSAALFESALPGAAREVRNVARVIGSVGLTNDARSLSFAVTEVVLDPELPPEPQPDPAASALVLRRELQVEWSRQFTADLPDFSRMRLPLPLKPGEAHRHLELFAKLVLGGADEATAEQQDVLDVPLLPRPVLELELVDEVGEPLADEVVSLAFEGRKLVLTTDTAGRVRVENPPAPVAEVEPTNLDSLRSKLKTRWDQPRRGPRLSATPGTLVVLLSELPQKLAVTEGATRLSVQPEVIEADLVGAAFDTNKAFLLPSPSLIAALRGLTALYAENPDATLLIVGHADAAGDVAYNDALSLERAESLKAYLTDDVDAWLAWYGPSVPVQKRWGGLEDSLMLGAQPDTPELMGQPDPLRAFQEARGLDATGDIDEATRKELIRGYMSQDGTTLPAGTTVVEHGCGEHFPLDGSTSDGAGDPKNRRVELFFFDRELGVQPPPPGKNSKRGGKEYPEWRRRASDTRTFLVENRDRKLRVRLELEREPLANERYQLFIDDFLMGAGTTDADALIEQFVPSDAKLVSIRLPGRGIERLLELTPKEAFPGVRAPKGVQLRLRHLGFYLGEIDGLPSAAFDVAILAFKKAEGLPEDSTLDDATRAALVEAYGS